MKRDARLIHAKLTNARRPIAMQPGNMGRVLLRIYKCKGISTPFLSKDIGQVIYREIINHDSGPWSKNVMSLDQHQRKYARALAGVLETFKSHWDITLRDRVKALLPCDGPAARELLQWIIHPKKTLSQGARQLFPPPPSKYLKTDISPTVNALNALIKAYDEYVSEEGTFQKEAWEGELSSRKVYSFGCKLTWLNGQLKNKAIDESYHVDPIILEVVKGLDPKHQYIFRRYFQEGALQIQLASELSMTQGAISYRVSRLASLIAFKLTYPDFTVEFLREKLYAIFGNRGGNNITYVDTLVTHFSTGCKQTNTARILGCGQPRISHLMKKLKEELKTAEREHPEESVLWSFLKDLAHEPYLLQSLDSQENRWAPVLSVIKGGRS